MSMQIGKSEQGNFLALHAHRSGETEVQGALIAIYYVFPASWA